MPARIFIAYDNTVTITAMDGDESQDISAATKISVWVGNNEINSVDDPQLFDLSDLVTGKVKLLFGQSELSVGIYPIRFITYDVNHPNGLVWAHETDENPAMLRIVSNGS